MNGAVAAGNRLTAEAGARVLAAGGNAVDACIGAAFTAAVTEGPLTGPTGGGFLLAWVDGEATLLDCFFAAPSRPLGEIEDLTIDFGDSTQSYHIGEGSVAVPGLVAGLEEAHRRFGERPLGRARPAGDRARARRRRHDRVPALPPPDPRRDPPARRGRPSHLRRRRPDRDDRLRRDPRAPSRRRHHGRGGAAPGARGRPRRLPRPGARASAQTDRRARRADDPGALAGRRDRRGHAGAARLGRDARGAGARAPARLRSGAAAPHRGDDPHLRARRRRERGRALLDPRRRRRHLPRRHAAEQHARRARRDRRGAPRCPAHGSPA